MKVAPPLFSETDDAARRAVVFTRVEAELLRTALLILGANHRDDKIRRRTNDLRIRIEAAFRDAA